jgi:putative SOS response-associated peptidase YedK
MCGRYTLSSTPARINTQFSVTVDPERKPNYNVAPGTDVLIVYTDSDSGARRSDAAYWGFTPSWVKPGGSGPRPINARSEGVATKSMFKNAFARRRCILPADGFYEWKALDHGKQPWLIRLRDQGVFGFAGIYEPANDTTGNRPSCAILTTEANRLMRAIHQRMPVIIGPDDYDQWLKPAPTLSGIGQLLRPYQPDDLVAYPVSTRVNSTKNNDENLIRPLPDA